MKYNRIKAVEYAKKWAYARNPEYYNFDAVGGDCTSFISQCIYAGESVMNYSKTKGWYYINGDNKSPSWSGVEFLYQFLINNKGIGPYAKNVKIHELELGDIIQLSFDGKTYGHSMLVVQEGTSLDKIGVATHTFDSYNRKVSSYTFQKARFIHIVEIRKNV